MKQNAFIQAVEKEQLKQKITNFKVGDTVSVHLRIVDGDKERLQVFTGIVIARTGAGLSETFSLYRISYGSSMEKVLMLHSPKIAKIEVVKRGKVRKAKLYYLRGKSGKKSKVQEMLVSAQTTATNQPANAPETITG